MKGFEMVAEKLVKETTSLCPECLAILPAKIIEEDGKIYIEKTCERHGHVKELYWGCSDMYHKVKKYGVDGKKLLNPHIKMENPVCPFNCGICSQHKGHTALGNIVVTNRCDLNCWYCFFFAEKAGYVYEPALEEIRLMARSLKSEKPIGCNAIQLSVDKDERIIVRGKNKIVRTVRIGEFVDALMQEKGVEIKNLPIRHESSRINHYEVLSLDQNHNPAFQPVFEIIRHKNKGAMYRITTTGGREIKTTGAHSLFIMGRNGKLETKPVSVLSEGDVLFSALKVPNEPLISSVNLIEAMEKNCNKSVLEKIVVTGFSEEELRRYEKEAKKRINWDYVSMKLYRKLKLGKKIRYFNSKKEKSLPINLSLTPELMRLLGYYVGQGCRYRNGIIFTFGLKEKEIIADHEKCLKTVFGETHFRKIESRGTAIQIYLEGHLYKLFFEALGAGNSSRTKTVPWLVFNSSDDLKKEFLKAYFKCDGNVKTRSTGFEINHNTVSKNLAADLVFLHAQLDITLKIEKSISRSHKIEKTGQMIKISSLKYRLVISGKENLSKALWYLDSGMRKQFEKYLSNEEMPAAKFQRIPLKNLQFPTAKTHLGDLDYLLKRVRHDESISKQNLGRLTDYWRGAGIEFDAQLNSISHGNLGFFKIKKIDKLCSKKEEYVYDLSVPGSQAFFAGTGMLLAHNTGGEPTLRDDLVDIVNICKDEGISHVQVNTDGIRMSKDLDLCQRLKAAGVNTLYLSFDGVTAKTNPKNHWEVPGILENCRKVGAGNLGIVLVPTVINSVNDHELGDIIRFGLDNIDVVRAVNFQPVSLVGRMPKEERDKYRITIPDAVKRIEEQTDGAIAKEDFYTIPIVVPISRFLEQVTGRPYYELSSHHACGMATYLFKEGDKIIPINRFLDTEAFVEFLNEKAEELAAGQSKYLTGLKLLYKLNSFIDKSKQPKSLNFGKMLYNIFMKRDYQSLGAFHKQTLFIGMMHFMDLYNYDIERVEKCCIHYAVPGGKVIPFCAFNVIPQLYRDKIQKAAGLSIEEWEKKTGRTLKDDLYKRKVA